MSRVITREQFMESCPTDLKKRIEDFFIYFSEKKKSSTFLNPNESKGTEQFDRNNRYQKKKQSNIHFKKPFEKSLSDFDKVIVDYRGVISKLNETNQDAIWKELLELHLEKYINNPDIKLDENGKSMMPAEKSNQREIALIFYQYTRLCSMYLKEYIDLINKLKKNKDLSPYATEYIQLVFNDLNSPKEEDKEYNVLTHKIFAELTSFGLVTKKKFISSGLVGVYNQIIKNLEECENNEESLEILIYNFKRMGGLIFKDKEVSKIIDAMIDWKATKTFTGKLHFNIIDILMEVEKWRGSANSSK